MIPRLRRLFATLLIVCLVAPSIHASVYNQKPKLVVLIVIDQFRGDYLERFRDQFGPGGFRMLMDHGAWFTECYYDYANTQTAPGHATLGTGAYTDGHGIPANEWYDPDFESSPLTGPIITSVFDQATKTVGAGAGAPGASPHNLRADTFSDELRLATHGRSRVFGIALKDRAAILPVGYSANAAYWIEKDTGGFQSSTYYMNDVPEWVAQFNADDRAGKYRNRQWKSADGKVMFDTSQPYHIAYNNRDSRAFYDVVGRTPFANDYEFEFARELVMNEKLGQGDTTDVLAISLSANDILGHQVGPDSPEMKEMALALDHQLADFFGFLGRQFGLANVWIALSADHGIGYFPSESQKLHIPGMRLNGETLQSPLNLAISKQFPRLPVTEYVKDVRFPYVYLSKEDFEKAGVKDEEKAERMAGDAISKYPGILGYYTRTQLARGDVPQDAMGRKYLHSYSPITTWYVQLRLAPFLTDYASDLAHFQPYSYDAHVPLILYGLPFQPGLYRTHSEPVDLAPTITSLLGTNKPTSAVGRVLTEALTPATMKSVSPPEPAKTTAKPAEKPE